MKLELGISPCPNDTFAFHALLHGLVTVPGLEMEARLQDVETLNQLARRGEMDVAKVSYGALPFLLDEYVLLRSGGALGRGCGPLIVAPRAVPPAHIPQLRIAIPGRLTTANLLLRLHSPAAPPAIEMEYSEIMPAVAAGEVDAGLIIHESRFTYPEYGLTRVIDLGAWWEETTGCAIPLGAIVARRSLGAEVIDLVESAIRESVRFAFEHPLRSADFVRANAQEMSDEVIRRHIDLYVNEFSVDLGPEGESAVRGLIGRGTRAGLFGESMPDPFARGGSVPTSAVRSS